MKPAAGAVIDLFGHGGGESNHVVVERLFELALPRHKAPDVGEAGVKASLDPGKIFRGYDAFLDQGLACEEFDLQPNLELVFVCPDGPHFRAGIASNHQRNEKLKRRK